MIEDQIDPKLVDVVVGDVNDNPTNENNNVSDDADEIMKNDNESSTNCHDSSSSSSLADDKEKIAGVYGHVLAGAKAPSETARTKMMNDGVADKIVMEVPKGAKQLPFKKIRN